MNKPSRDFKIVPDSSLTQVWDGNRHIATFQSHRDALAFVDGFFLLQAAKDYLKMDAKGNPGIFLTEGRQQLLDAVDLVDGRCR
jgi:hypothetical protein